MLSKSVSTDKVFGSFTKKFFPSRDALKTHKAYRLMLAEAKLLDRVIRIKGYVEKDDYLCVIAIFKRKYGINGEDTKELFKTIHGNGSSALKTKAFTNALKKHLETDRLMQILESLWLVAYAGGKIEPSQRSIIRRITRAIGLTDEDSMDALKRAHRRNQLMQTDLFSKPLF